MFSLFRQKPKLKKEVYDQLLYGTPIEPVYGVTSFLTPNNERRWGTNETDFLFYENFRDFDRTINEWYQDDAFRLQERDTTEVVRLFSDSPRYGRSYSVFYNKIEIGRLEIADFHDFGNKMCEFNLELYSMITQYLPFNDVFRFIVALGQLLVSSSETEQLKFQLNATNAMSASAWQIDQDGTICRSDIIISSKSVPYYFEYREKLSEGS